MTYAAFHSILFSVSTLQFPHQVSKGSVTTRGDRSRGIGSDGGGVRRGCGEWRKVGPKQRERELVGAQ